MGRRPLFLLVGALALLQSGSALAEIRIGFAGPLSGPYATSGARSRVAVELAVADLNRNGGVLGQPVTLTVADDGCGLQPAMDAARQLVGARVHAVIGHLCSHSSLLAAGIYETADVVMITPSSTHPRLTEEGRQNVFRLKGRDDQQGKLAADLLAAHWSGAAIAILHDGSVYGEDLAQQARRRLRANGVAERLFDRYTPGADDYSRLAARLQAAGIEVLYLGGYGPDAGRILRALRARGDDLQLVGGDGLAMDEFWRIAGNEGAGTLFSTRPDPTGLPAADALIARLAGTGNGDARQRACLVRGGPGLGRGGRAGRDGGLADRRSRCCAAAALRPCSAGSGSTPRVIWRAPPGNGTVGSMAPTCRSPGRRSTSGRPTRRPVRGRRGSRPGAPEPRRRAALSAPGQTPGAQTGPAFSGPRDPTGSRLDGAHADVAAGRVLERLQLAVARLARGHLLAGVSGVPVPPVRPPGARMLGCAGQPVRGLGG